MKCFVWVLNVGELNRNILLQATNFLHSLRPIMLTFTLMPCLFFNEIQAYILQHKVYNYNDNSTQPIMQHKPINLTRHTNVKTVLLWILFKVYTLPVNSLEQSSTRSGNTMTSLHMMSTTNHRKFSQKFCDECIARC